MLSPTTTTRHRAHPPSSASASLGGSSGGDDVGILDVYARAAAARRAGSEAKDGGGHQQTVVKVGGTGWSLGLSSSWSLTFDGRDGMGFCDEVVLDTGESPSSGIPPVALRSGYDPTTETAWVRGAPLGI